jgi:Mu transposase, C-terminal domain/IstB-like ATP binding protein
VDPRGGEHPDPRTTGEPPIVRFQRDEADALQPLAGRPPFQQIRELTRRVQTDCCIEVDGNADSVPWRLVGEGWSRSAVAGFESCTPGRKREIAHKDERRIEVAFGLAKFPFVRDLAGFDFKAQPSLDPKQIR